MEAPWRGVCWRDAQSWRRWREAAEARGGFFPMRGAECGAAQGGAAQPPPPPASAGRPAPPPDPGSYAFALARLCPTSAAQQGQRRRAGRAGKGAGKGAPSVFGRGESWRDAAAARGGFFPTPVSAMPPQQQPMHQMPPTAPSERSGDVSPASSHCISYVPEPSPAYMQQEVCSLPPCSSPAEWDQCAMGMRRYSQEWVPSDTESTVSEASSSWYARAAAAGAPPHLRGGVWETAPSPSALAALPPGWHWGCHWNGAVPQPQQHFDGGAAISPCPQGRGKADPRHAAAAHARSAPAPAAAPPPVAGGAGAVGYAAVRELLEDLGFSQYASAFFEAGLDRIDLVATATDEDMTDCGVKKVHRRRILAEAARRVNAAGGAPSRAAPNPLMSLPAAAPTQQSRGEWSAAEEARALDWLRAAAAEHRAQVCVISAKYQPKRATLAVHYVSAAGGAVPNLAALLRAAQAHFLCRVWVGPAKEIVEALSEEKGATARPGGSGPAAPPTAPAAPPSAQPRRAAHHPRADSPPPPPPPCPAPASSPARSPRRPRSPEGRPRHSRARQLSAPPAHPTAAARDAAGSGRRSRSLPPAAATLAPAAP
eukprot:TRINITY_DN462_c1_g1_i1.p1 TRINITY_DN462_c1_g1~~TRINITY_DN462_c1_g1_i1.p1  ORF type:complete len:666 (+),score=182.14 TRINITY_DN462_c1_g1_i1:211-1998(+)